MKKCGDFLRRSFILVLCASVFALCAASFPVNIAGITVGGGFVSVDFEQFTSEVSNIYKNYPTEEPIIHEFYNDELFNEDDTLMIASDLFTFVTGDEVQHTGNELTISNDAGCVTMTANERMITNNSGVTLLTQSVSQQGQTFYFPITEVASNLGYSVDITSDGLKLTRPFQLKRVIIKSNIPQLDKRGAVAWAEGYNNWHIFQYETEAAAIDACNYYNTLPDVNFAEADFIVTTSDYYLSDSDTIQNQESAVAATNYLTWGAESMGISTYQQYLGTVPLREVIVAVLDTGIDQTHPMFQGRLLMSYARDFTDSGIYDGQGHGTHVAGTIVDITFSNVQIVPVKVLGNDGRGANSGIVMGMEYVAKLREEGTLPNLRVMNMSLGSAVSDCYTAMNNAVEAAYSAGVFTTAAAMNESEDATKYAPANCDKAITVAALDRIESEEDDEPDTLVRAGFSGWGACIDIAAPGVSINSAKPGNAYQLMNGTSMATPHVSGAIALLFSDGSKNYSMSSLETTLFASAIDLGDPGKDMHFGWGAATLENISHSFSGGASEEPDDVIIWMPNSLSFNDATCLQTSYVSTPTPAQCGELTITYSLKEGSILPDGLSLNTSDCTVYGSVTAMPGTYTFTIVAVPNCVCNESMVEKTFTLQVNKATPTAPTGTLEIIAHTDTGVTLTDMGADYEYSLDADTWQTSNVFTGLESGAEYNFYTRKIASTYYYPSTSIGTTWTTVVNAQAPTFTTQPTGTTVDAGDPVVLTVAATVTDGGVVSYQWYKNTNPSTTDGTPISGATSTSYTVPTTATGTMYYYVVTTNTNESVTGNTTTTNTSIVVAVIVNAAFVPPTPVATAITSDTVTISRLEAASNGQIAEYAVSTVNNPAGITQWQTDVTFSGLDANTTYYFFARLQANHSYEAGEASVALVVKTSQNATTPPGDGLSAGMIALYSCLGVLGIGLIGFCIYRFGFKRRRI